MQKSKFQYITPIQNINSKWIINLKVKPKLLNFWKKTKEKLYDLGLGNDFSDMNLEAQTAKEQVDKLDFIKIKTFALQMTL